MYILKILHIVLNILHNIHICLLPLRNMRFLCWLMHVFVCDICIISTVMEPRKSYTCFLNIIVMCMESIYIHTHFSEFG